MSIAVITIWKNGMTEEKYQQLTQAMSLQDSLPKGCESHVAGIAKDGTFIVSDIWESAKAHDKFMSERIGPTSDVLNIAAPDTVTTLDLVRSHVRSFHMAR
jgi:hypothetical protein